MTNTENIKIVIKIDQTFCQKIDEKIEIAKNTGSLDLQGLFLDKIPAKVFKLKNLKYLNLSCNNIKSLPFEINKLQNLEYLDVSYNYIHNIIDYTLDLPKLKVLNCA